MGQPRSLTLLALALAGGTAACAQPGGFVRTSDPPVIPIDVREGMPYDEAWTQVRQAVASQAVIDISSKEDGVLKTAWRVDGTYRVRTMISFAADRKSLELRNTAEYGKPTRRKEGYDSILLDALAGDLREVVGNAPPRKREKQEAPVPRPEKPRPMPPAASRVEVSARADLWLTSFDGKAQARERGGGAVTWVTFEDGGIDDRETIPRLRLEVTTQTRNGLYMGGELAYWDVDGSGSDILEHEEGIGGEIFPAGTPVESKFSFNLLELSAVVGRRATEDSPWAWRLSPGPRFYWSRFDLESAPESETAHFTTFGLGSGFRVEWHAIPEIFVSGGLEANLVAIGFMAEGEVAAGAETGPLRVEVGYRQFYLDHVGSITRSRESLVLTVGGPFVGVTLRF